MRNNGERDMKVMRNDPCPCGSGKKYKKCCLAGDSPADASQEQLTWRRVRRSLEGCVPRMMTFVIEIYGPDAIHEAWSEFNAFEEGCDEFNPGTPHLQLFLPWFFHCWTPDPHATAVQDESLHDRSPTTEYLARRGRSMDTSLRAYVTACAATPLSFYEVLSPQPDCGFVARDILTGDEYAVLERSATASLTENDIVFAQIVRIDGIAMLEACPPFGLPPINRIQILDQRDKILRRAARVTVDMLRDYDIELRNLYLSMAEAVLYPAMPQLQNTDGHALSPQQLIFDIDSLDSSFAALKSLAHDSTDDALLQSAQRDRAGALKRVRFDWTKAGNQKNPGWNNTVLGSIDITRKRLTCEVNSDERAVELCGLVEARLGVGARYRLTKMQSVEAALAKGSGASGSSEAVRAEMARLQQEPAVEAEIQRMMAAHYDTWPSQSLPALGGQTPEQAIRDATGREKVEALLCEMERHATRHTPALDPQVLSRLRERLGLSD